MKRILAIFLIMILVIGVLGGCRSTQDGPDIDITNAPNETDTVETTEAQTDTAEGTELPFTPETRPSWTPTAPSVPIETIPRGTDDSDYQLPPGEKPTINPEDM